MLAYSTNLRSVKCFTLLFGFDFFATWYDRKKLHFSMHMHADIDICVKLGGLQKMHKKLKTNFLPEPINVLPQVLLQGASQSRTLR